MHKILSNNKGKSAVTDSLLSPTIVIEAQNSWGRLNLKELWEYRHLFRTLVVRDIKSRYRMTALGPLWFIIGPFFNMVVLSLVFGELANFYSEGLPYPIFVFTATLPWSLFSSSFERARGSLLEYMSWISKIYIPHLMLPLISIATGLFDWAISLLILFGLMIFYHTQLNWAILVLPLYVVITLIAALAFGFWSAPLSVRFRDFARLTGYIVSALYYATPVIYSGTLIPQKWLWLYQLNPMYWVIEGFRWAILGIGQPPQVYMLIPIGLLILILISGAFVFERASRNIVDIK